MHRLEIPTFLGLMLKKRAFSLRFFYYWVYHAIFKNNISSHYKGKRKADLENLDNYFCACHKNQQKHSQLFKLLFLKMNLHFGLSNSICTYEKVNFLKTVFIWSSIFFYSILHIFFSSILHIFAISLKRNDSQTFKSSSCKKFSLQCVYSQ